VIRVKKAVLRAMGELGGDPKVQFLKDILYKSDTHELRLQAARSLKRMGRIELLKQSQEELSEKERGIVKHSMDDRI
jgi:hypothetical protein